MSVNLLARALGEQLRTLRLPRRRLATLSGLREPYRKFTRMVQRGKPSGQAAVAVARELHVGHCGAGAARSRCSARR